jgi:hypothetical protein
LNSPAELIPVEQRPINGKPDPAHISTSYVERQNLTMRMGMRRFTRLTNGFSKKVENLEHPVSLHFMHFMHFMHYNFARIHKTLRVTPAMEAGLTDHVDAGRDCGAGRLTAFKGLFNLLGITLVQPACTRR